MKANRLYTLHFIGIGICLLFIFCKGYPKNTGKKYTYRGKFTIEIYLNNELKDRGGNFLIFDQYLFEKDESFHFTSTSAVDKEGNITEEESSQHSTLDGFMLTNLKTDTCFRFGTDSIKPVLKSKISTSQKKTGLLMKDNLDELKPYLNGITFLKDTLIGHDKFKLLISDQSNNPDSKIVKRIIFYLNTSLKDFPFHPISKLLDEKFGGVIFKYSYITTKGEVQDIVYHYTDGLTETDTKNVQRFVKAAGIN